MSKDKITALVPSTMNEAHELAKVYAASQLLPAELRNKPADVFVTIMAGMELGMAPMAALRSIHIIKGQPVLSADAMVACAQSSGACEYFRAIESNNRIATYETKRKGSEPVQRSFTIDDAKQAQLLGNPTWKKYPAAMLRARCKADLARDVYPDAVAGVYIPDEADAFTEPRREHNGHPVNGTQTAVATMAIVDAIDAEIVEDGAPDDAPVSAVKATGTLKAEAEKITTPGALAEWARKVKDAKDAGRIPEADVPELTAIYRQIETALKAEHNAGAEGAA